MGKLKNSKDADRWRIAVEEATDGLWDWELKTGRCFYSPRWKEILGYSDDEIGNSIEEWTKRINPDDLEMAISTADRCLIKGETEFYSLEHRMICKDGNVKWILSSGKIIEYDNDNKPERAIGIHKDISEIKNAQESLRINENKLRKKDEELEESYRMLNFACSTANFGMWRYYTSDGLFRCNEVVSDIFEVPHNIPFTFEQAAVFYPPASRKKIYDFIFDCLESGKPFNDVVKVITSTGKLIWIRATGQSVKDEQETITGLMGSVQDITAIREAEEELRRTHESLKLSLSASNSGTWDWNVENNIFYWSPEMYSLMGVDPSVSPGIEAWTSSLHPDDHAHSWIDLQTTMDSGNQCVSDFRVILPGKRIRWIRSIGNTIYNNGTPVRMNGLCIDITDRKNTEEELMKHRDHLEDLVNNRSEQLQATLNEVNDLYENAPCGYHSLDSSGTFTRINNTELEWLGYKREEVVGVMKFKDILSPESVKVLQSHFPEFLRTGRNYDIEFEFVRKNGSVFNVSVNSTAVYDLYGELKYSRSSVFDVTHRKMLEEKLIESGKRLELAIRAGGVGIWDWDVKNNILVWDDGMLNLYGTTRDNFKGDFEAWLNSVHPDDRNFALN